MTSDLRVSPILHSYAVSIWDVVREEDDNGSIIYSYHFPQPILYGRIMYHRQLLPTDSLIYKRNTNILWTEKWVYIGPKCIQHVIDHEEEIEVEKKRLHPSLLYHVQTENLWVFNTTLCVTQTVSKCVRVRRQRLNGHISSGTMHRSFTRVAQK